MASIQLSISNLSQSDSIPKIVMYQRNLKALTSRVVAWSVLEKLGYEDFHPFLYQSEYQIFAVDSAGNKSKLQSVSQGQRLDIFKANGGLESALSNVPAASPLEFQVANLTSESIDIHVLNSGNLVYYEKKVAVQKVIDFQFSESIYLGAVSGVIKQGGELSTDMIAESINTQLPLKEIASADIIMSSATTSNNLVYQFSFKNVIYR